MLLDEGLRRLLRLASLSSTMAYARAPTGTMVLTTVSVFEAGMEPLVPPQLAVELPGEDRREDAGRSCADALAQLSSAVPPTPEGGKTTEQRSSVPCSRARNTMRLHPEKERRASWHVTFGRRLNRPFNCPLKPVPATFPSELSYGPHFLTIRDPRVREDLPKRH
jgi:hypothetical protein